MYCLCRSSKTIAVRIVLLDETDFLHELQDDLPGQALLDVVFARLNLIETAYFGIRYIDQDNQTHWLDPAARLSRQLKAGKVAYDLYFGVKFYACDPCKLVEEITRYQLYLQVKQDILQGRLPVSFELAAELGAYVVQAELGNYDPRKHPPGYVSEFRLLNNQTKEIESRIHELHIQLEGMSPSQAEFNYLDKVKWHDMYGVDLHPVLGEDSVEYFLGLTPGGIVVLRNKTTVAHYYWPRIAKVYYKGRYFMLRVCDKNNEVSTYGFETPKKSACKHLWKCCVEHHSFFRLVRVAPMQATTGTLGSKYSGRSDRQPMKDGATQQRIQPTFTRTPSRRQPRRVLHDPQQEAEKLFDAPKYIQQEIKSVSIPQPAQSFESPYRSTCSIPAALNGSANGAVKSAGPMPPDSPRSTRSAPWMRSQQRGLFGINSSPKSVRSASTRMSAPANNTRMRSSSVESHSSNESRSGRRRRHRSRRVSDNESEMSRGSGRSGRSHNSHRKHRRHRSKNRRNRSDTESRDRSYSGHRRSTDSIELVDSGEQWLEVQRKQHSDAVPKAAVIKSSQVMKGAHPDSGIVQHHQHRSRRHRKHRSPSEKIWSSELTKHLQFDLVDTTGMTEDQLREIPYTVVETNHAAKKPNTLKVHKTSHHSTTSLSSSHHHSHQVNNNRIDRIREYPKGDGSLGENGVNGGSIRSASTISSSRDYDRSSGLIRMMSSMSMGDFISPTGSSLSPLDSSGLRVSHEHTDSGLGADQDYAYSSERSSDSAKYGTNKSSGASVTSGHTKSSSSNNMKSHHHTVSNRKPPLCPGRSGSQLPITQQPQLQQHQQQPQQQQQTHPQLPQPFSPVPGVHSANGSNSRLINTSNTHYQNNHYTFSLTRNTHQSHHAPLPHQQQLRHHSTNNPGGNRHHHQHQQQLQSGGRPHHPGSGSIGSGLSTSTYLDTVATLSSSATPYHYFYDGTGFRTNVGLHHPISSTMGTGVRGTKSDIGVPIRPKRHHFQQHQQQQQQQAAGQHLSSVHSFKRQPTADRRQPSPSSAKSIDYLENYKTGVERLNQGNGLNNNSPETFAGLLGRSSSGNQNVLNNNNNEDDSHPQAKGQGEGGGVGAGDVVGPLICFDSNRNRDESTTVVGTPTRDGGQGSAANNARSGDNGNGSSGGTVVASPTERRPSGQSSRESPAKGTELGKRPPLAGSSPARFGGGAGKHSNHRSSSLELILTPIIQSRR
ncbi:transcription initiation factor TFIID subunit 1 [Anopheles ziemanni]|uniref:transcription initiation factor TFIID subunit 1 n=1 Tax=Anopheles coustani TaxID=139045 RepID=UPI00265890B8|nr:transcription initiation factor TFIID subunit 1 [Anopheles coustani]XP_058169171.1 transcription initiation factor TFIID subunit 1 [Anopheles ziemanni]